MKTLAQLLINCLLLATLVLSSSVESRAGNAGRVDEESLRGVLASGETDTLLVMLNEVKRDYHARGELLPFLITLWNDNEELDPNVNWETARKPIVRMEIGNILMQAHRNERIEVDVSEIQSFTREHLTGTDPDVTFVAILNLALVDDQSDVEAIREVGQSGNNRLFKAAAIALAKMCAEPAADALGELEATAESDGMRDFVRSVRQSLGSRKRCR